MIQSGGFTIKSLLKLDQARAFDNKTTFLHYMVLVVQRNSEQLLDFKDDLPSVSKAEKIYWDQCVGELEEVETQLENVRKLALHEAKASKVMYSLPKKKATAEEEDRDSDDLSVESMSLEDEVALLRSTKIGMFALGAIRKVSQLRERADLARDKFEKLLEYFGESRDSSMQPHELFEVINTFCRNFDAARADVERTEKAKVSAFVRAHCWPDAIFRDSLSFRLPPKHQFRNVARRRKSKRPTRRRTRISPLRARALRRVHRHLVTHRRCPGRRPTNPT